MIDTCEIRVTVGEAEIAQYQIPPSALMQAFLGCGFGCGSVAVLVTIRDMSQSQMITVVRKKCCMTSMGSYQLVSLDHLQ
jgi:hypothetical protein